MNGIMNERTGAILNKDWLFFLTDWTTSTIPQLHRQSRVHLSSCHLKGCIKQPSKSRLSRTCGDRRKSIRVRVVFFKQSWSWPTWMFLKKSKPIVQSANNIRLMQSHFTSQENQEPWPKARDAMNVRRGDMVDRNILFRESSRKRPRSKPWN